MIQARLELEDSVVLDLFAGSGALGLEALSRGAARAVFIEHDARCCACIGKNARQLQLEGFCRVLHTCAKAGLAALAREGTAFDLLLLDPPYAIPPWDIVAELTAAGLMRPGALLTVEHTASSTPCPTSTAGPAPDTALRPHFPDALRPRCGLLKRLTAPW